MVTRKKASKKTKSPATTEPTTAYSNEIINFLMQHWDEVPENTKTQLFNLIMKNIQDGLVAFTLESAIYNKEFASDIVTKITDWLKAPAKDNLIQDDEEEDEEDDEDPCYDCEHEDEDGCHGEYSSKCPLGRQRAKNKISSKKIIESGKSNIDIIVEQACTTAMCRIKTHLSSQMEGAVLLGMQDQFELVCEIKTKRTGEVVSSISGPLTFE